MKTHGEITTYSQHTRFFNLQKQLGCPWLLWLQDLQRFITDKLEKGDQIILITDINKNIRSNNVQQWLTNIGLREIITTTHKDIVLMVDNGSQTINGVFASHSLTAIWLGYLGFGEFQSNHRCLWVDFLASSLLGFRPPAMLQPQARRLQCSIPSVNESGNKITYMH